MGARDPKEEGERKAEVFAAGGKATEKKGELKRKD